MEKGIVKWFDELKGFGFITPEVGGKEIFVHKSNVTTLDQVLDKGDRVEYELGEGSKGPEAKKVRVIDDEGT